MLRTLISAASLLWLGTSPSVAQLQKENCQTQGFNFQLYENSKVDYESYMDQNGCRYTFTSSGYDMTPRVIEKSVVMKSPQNGTLTQDGAFSFFYKPKPGFKGKDNFVIYVCGTHRNSAACARLNYNATIR
jgi:hypothetical protein